MIVIIIKFIHVEYNRHTRTIKVLSLKFSYDYIQYFFRTIVMCVSALLRIVPFNNRLYVYITNIINVT